MLGEAKVDDDGNVISHKDTNMMNLDKQSDDHEINVPTINYLSLLLFLRKNTVLSYDLLVFCQFLYISDIISYMSSSSKGISSTRQS